MKLLFKFMVSIVVALFLVALIGQLYAYMHPGYHDVAIDPHPDLGWTLVPNRSFIHTGDDWYAKELTVEHKVNSLGFLGPERPKKKDPDSVRIAFMGDSFVEALQVPYDMSVSALVEKNLNKESTDFTYEVLNFGVSNYSVGQYLSVWNAYGEDYSIDYVFIFLSAMQMVRIAQTQIDAGLPLSRPGYSLLDGRLRYHPVSNYQESKQAFDFFISERGGRNQKREQKIWIVDWIKSGGLNRFMKNLFPQQTRLAVKQLIGTNTIKPLLPTLRDKVKAFFDQDFKKQLYISEQQSDPELEISDQALELNFKVIKELNRKVKEGGGKLVIVDGSLYFWFMGANEVLTERIHQFAVQENIDYIPLYKDLLQTDSQNMWARFLHSHHFNEHGHAIFARKVLEWFDQNRYDSSLEVIKIENK